MTSSGPQQRLKRQLRQDIRRKRRSLTAPQQNKAARDLLAVLRGLNQYNCARRLAFYLPNDGEIDPCKLMEQAIKQGKICYLPVVKPLKQNRLHFVRYQSHTPLVENQFGILEPRLSTNRIALPWTLDVIFVPLVAFDRFGTRLGMGGGYYDRTLANYHASGACKPLLIGLAHSCQEVDRLQRSVWDVPMDLIATDQELVVVNSLLDNGQETR
ncbi:MAG: 5-formyltetrahydrofolate cyclo-ligase [Gammaproteobacteria bacterium]|nr:MAG: 5-formyltetrahydrofolate cyclo-ligase [Gammaproteobacteria bacterium]RLA53410.1 MAG: 5-formyltetrahydrofolate cyclo-ligase [Gammaproteobacteria bacterium]